MIHRGRAVAPLARADARPRRAGEEEEGDANLQHGDEAPLPGPAPSSSSSSWWARSWARSCSAFSSLPSPAPPPAGASPGVARLPAPLPTPGTGERRNAGGTGRLQAPPRRAATPSRLLAGDAAPPPPSTPRPSARAVSARCAAPSAAAGRPAPAAPLLSGRLSGLGANRRSPRTSPAAPPPRPPSPPAASLRRSSRSSARLADFRAPRSRQAGTDTRHALAPAAPAAASSASAGSWRRRPFPRDPRAVRPCDDHLLLLLGAAAAPPPCPPALQAEMRFERRDEGVAPLALPAVDVGAEARGQDRIHRAQLREVVVLQRSKCSWAPLKVRPNVLGVSDDPVQELRRPGAP